MIRTSSPGKGFSCFNARTACRSHGVISFNRATLQNGQCFDCEHLYRSPRLERIVKSCKKHFGLNVHWHDSFALHAFPSFYVLLWTRLRDICIHKNVTFICHTSALTDVRALQPTGTRSVNTILYQLFTYLEFQMNDIILSIQRRWKCECLLTFDQLPKLLMLCEVPPERFPITDTLSALMDWPVNEFPKSCHICVQFTVQFSGKLRTGRWLSSLTVSEFRRVIRGKTVILKTQIKIITSYFNHRAITP